MNERALVDAALALLSELAGLAPGVEGAQEALEVREEDTLSDGVLDVPLRGGSTQRWLVEVKAYPLEPRAAQLIAFKLHDALTRDVGRYAVVVAPYVSPRAGEILARAGIGFADLSGNCRIASGPLYVERTGFPNAFVRKTPLRSLFTPGSERVLRALLDPRLLGRTWTLRELAEAAFPGISLGQAHKVTRLLEEQAHLRREGRGLVVVEPGALLRSWSRAYRADRSEARRFYSPLEPPELGVRLQQANGRAGTRGRGALASFSAAEVRAPVVRQHRFFAYWTGDLGPLRETLELRPVESGDNVVLYAPYDEGVLYPGDVEGVALTCPVQTYLDLRSSPARGEEAAAAIFDRCLKGAYER
ncbi:MAG: type IV toxin-antitoxin system AbiEi family antitoxin [Thermoanaerobaculaceae bacterium]